MRSSARGSLSAKATTGPAFAAESVLPLGPQTPARLHDASNWRLSVAGNTPPTAPALGERTDDSSCSGNKPMGDSLTRPQRRPVKFSSGSLLCAFSLLVTGLSVDQSGTPNAASAISSKRACLSAKYVLQRSADHSSKWS